MKEYDLVVIGTGSGMELADAFIRQNPKAQIAVIDKDDPGGICLTRGCIPSKLLIYPAEVVRTIQRAGEFGVQAEILKVDSNAVMERMRRLIKADIDMIRHGLSNTENIDYYPTTAEFTAPYTLKVGEQTIKGKMIFLSTGSKPSVPNIEGLEQTGYLTSDSILQLKQLPQSFIIIGGGYIAAEYGNFLSAMGCKVTIIGRNPQFIPQEEPEISTLAKREMQKHATVLTGYDVRKVNATNEGKKSVTAADRENGEEMQVLADEIFVAAGRKSNADMLHPEKAGIKVDDRGFFVVDEYLQTTQPNVWAFGDANGTLMFKHVANYEVQVAYFNAVFKEKTKVKYGAIPHAVFTDPEIASVGLKEAQAVKQFGEENVLIGFHLYEQTAKGEAMAIKDAFVKIIIERKTQNIVGAHIIGPQASTLIQEVINIMQIKKQNALYLLQAMHIHPALPEVIIRAVGSLMTHHDYQNHFLEHHTNLLQNQKHNHNHEHDHDHN
ncbi:MAG: dihydrolipoyl dehydrogenase [Candidatus Bathyarchaeota archaeon]|nr:dihydrolipoyl dehydrogenase [Candidatus Bathyarchaeota archaeon]